MKIRGKLEEAVLAEPDEAELVAARLLRDGLDHPLKPGRLGEFLARTVEIVREGARRRGDLKTVRVLDQEGRSLVEAAVRRRKRQADRSGNQRAGPFGG